MSYVIDRAKCRGHAVCEMIAGEVFAVQEDGLAVVLKQPVDAFDIELANEAAESCPAAAILQSTSVSGERSLSASKPTSEGWTPK